MYFVNNEETNIIVLIWLQNVCICLALLVWVLTVEVNLILLCQNHVLKNNMFNTNWNKSMCREKNSSYFLHFPVSFVVSESVNIYTTLNKVCTHASPRSKKGLVEKTSFSVFSLGMYNHLLWWCSLYIFHTAFSKLQSYVPLDIQWQSCLSVQFYEAPYSFFLLSVTLQSCYPWNSQWVGPCSKLDKSIWQIQVRKD